MQQENEEKPVPAAGRPYAVSFVSGQVAADGRSILLRVETAEDDPIDLALGTADMQYLTTLLLLLGDKAVKLVDAPPRPQQLQMIPIPLRSLSLAESEEGETLLVLEVGGSALAVALPPEVMGDVGRSLLALSAARAPAS
jgi:hypothetical protein